MWLSYNTIVYKHVPTKFLRRKEMRNQGKNKYATKLLSLFHIKHPAAAYAMKGGQLIAFGPKHIIRLPKSYSLLSV